MPTSSTDHIPDNKAQTNHDREIDPYDFSDLEAKIKHQVDWLRDCLQKLRSGGRLGLETIEGFQVEIKHGLGGEGGQGKKVEKVRLGDLATVVPRGGRLIGVMVNEEAVRLSFTPSLPFSSSSSSSSPIIWSHTLRGLTSVVLHPAPQTHHNLHTILPIFPHPTTGLAKPIAAQYPCPASNGGITRPVRR